LDDVEFKLQLRVEDLLVLYSIARQENTSVHELILKAVRLYIASKVPPPTPSPFPIEKGKTEEGEKE